MKRPPRITIIEDEQIVTNDLKLTLRKFGYEVADLADSAQDAVDTVLASQPDLVLLSYHLHGESAGVRVCRDLLKYVDLPVVFLSKTVDEDLVASVKDAGGCGHVLKPYKEKDLIAAIESALFNHRTIQDLQHNVRWLSSTLNSADDAIIATDHTNFIRYINPKAQELTGWEECEALGKNLFQVFCLENAASDDVRPAADLHPDFDLSAANEANLLNKKGERIPIESTVSELKDPDKKIKGSVWVFRDVRVRKTMEIKIRDYISFSAILRETMSALQFAEDFERAHASISTGFEKAFGISATALFLFEDGRFRLKSRIGLSAELANLSGKICMWREEDVHARPLILGENDLCELSDRFNEKWRAENFTKLALYPLAGETKLTGGLFIFIDSAPIQDDDVLGDGLVLAEACALALSRIKHAVFLRNSRKKYEDIFESAACCIFACSADWKIKMANAAFADLSGYDSVEELQKYLTFPDMFSSAEAFHEIDDCLITSEIYTTADANLRRRDGTEFTAAIKISKVEDANTGLVFFTGTVEDRTVQINVENQKHRLEKEKLNSVRREGLEQMATGIAEEFNNMLIGIIGNSNLALAELPSDTFAGECLQAAIQVGERATDFTNQLLAFSGKGSAGSSLVKLSKFVSEGVKQAGRKINERIHVEQNHEEQAPFLMADPEQVQSIINQLLSNAIDALGEAGGTITISTQVASLTAEDITSIAFSHGQPPGEYVLMEIVDNGCGMNPQTLARAFDPCFTTRHKRRGFGLALVLGAVRSHGGMLHVVSRENDGACFQTYFPIPVDPRTAPARVSRAREPDEPQTTILVADENETVRDVSRRILERGGFSVHLVENGGGILAELNRFGDSIDLIVLDLTTVRSEGREMLERLQHSLQNARIVAICSKRNQGRDEFSAGHGFTAFLEKPFTPEELLSSVNKALTAVVEMPAVSGENR